MLPIVCICKWNTSGILDFIAPPPPLPLGVASKYAPEHHVSQYYAIYIPKTFSKRYKKVKFCPGILQSPLRTDQEWANLPQTIKRTSFQLSLTLMIQLEAGEWSLGFPWVYRSYRYIGILLKIKQDSRKSSSEYRYTGKTAQTPESRKNSPKYRYAEVKFLYRLYRYWRYGIFLYRLKP